MSNSSVEQTPQGAQALALEPPAHSRPHRASWPAIMAGAVAALAVQLMWSLLGTSIGMSGVEILRAKGTSSAHKIGIAAGLWWILSSCAALGAGGWVAAHLAGCRGKLDGALHGGLTWAVTTLVGAFLVGSVLGPQVMGAVGFFETAGSAGLANQAEPRPSDVEKPGPKDPGQTRRWEAPAAPANTEAAWAEWQAERRARELAEATARATTRIALWSFIALLLSAAAAALGGLAESFRRSSSVKRTGALAAEARQRHIPRRPLFGTPVAEH